ncbi:SDR family NAD(P)-dependent oxidoreductase [Sphaerisporangium sp. NPDC051011]|uniref:SDR family NAD(P)-dependent oxidoreductase n=1 Tax=Sphaerisporangium sp. NPDC051011 TaxID=3155792 RepID=UPI0033CCB65E
MYVVNTHEGRIAMVTGAASGNGLAIAEKLLAEGAQVALIDVNADALDKVCGPHENAFPIVADVTDPDSMAEAVRRTENAWGGLDILVNNAGIVRGSAFDDLEPAEWEEVFRVNSTGPFLASKAAVPAIRRTLAGKPGATGAIVNITSVEAHIVISSSGHPQIHYNASKGALLMFTKGLAVEAAASGIRVNAVAPGFIETPFTRTVLAKPEVRQWLLDRTPMGRIGRPEDVANAVSFLSSEAAGFVTGTTLFVDGGWLVH